MRAHLEEETVAQANAHFWEQMLSMKMVSTPIPAEFCVPPGHFVASVELFGIWKGSVEVRIARELGKSATAAMLMQPVEELSEADTLDAVKEIANMIAGGIKSALPRPCSMKVPASALHLEKFCGTARTEDSLTLAFQHEKGDLLIRVLELEYPA